ncbi:MAG: sialate O-acetylesterase, partial [Calditrichaceae bacterium]
MYISLNNKKRISLAGDWRYRVGLDYSELNNIGVNLNNPNYPTLLSNAMIAPLIPVTFRGVIWYQGESNAEEAYKYRSLFPALIRDWRRRWDEGNFPFLFVQLANYMERKQQPGDDSWAELREAQLMALDLPNTGMAVTIDIGNAKDIH